MPEPCNPPCGGEHGGVRWALNAPFDEGGQALDWQDACDMIEAAYPRYTALHKRGWWRKANEYWQSLRQYHTADIVKVPLL
jgi:hypothetical protein